MSEHTKTPWLLSSTFLICSDEARIIANCIPAHDVPVLAIPSPEAAANAAFIVRACNSHAALVKALEAIAKMSDSTEAWTHDEPWGNESDAWENGQSRGHFDAAVIARAALKLAGAA